MGWGIAKDAREKHLSGCHALKRQLVSAGKSMQTPKKKIARDIIHDATACLTLKQKPKPKQQQKQKQEQAEASNCQFPTELHSAVVDAAAAFRRVAFTGCSALRAATSVLKTANISKPQKISVLFDLSDGCAYPPQRAELHRQRYAGKHLAYDDAVAIFKKLRCKKEDILTYPITRPLLLRTDLDWNLLFMDKQLKRFVFKIFAAALKHAAVGMFATHDIVSDGEVHVWTQTKEHTCITASTIKSVPATTLFSMFGEGDLRCYASVLQMLLHGTPVVLHSIDTDFLLMVLCAAPWLPTIPKYMITLSDTVYDGNKILTRFMGKSETDKINSAYWALAFGTDYSNPLTNNGYFNKEIIQLMNPATHCRRPITILNDTDACFDLKKALFVLKPLRCSLGKKVPKDSLQTTLVKMLFCLQYYGLMFVDTENTLFPKMPVLDSKSCTFTFKYKPCITSITNTGQ